MEKILVEVRPSAAGTFGDLSAQPAVPEVLMDRLGDLGESLKLIADRLSDQLEELEKKRTAHWHLDTVELKFSIDLETEAGVIIARTKAGAAFEASLSWKFGSA